jgi:NhaA family Na+:H+ antiporter
MIRLTRLFNEFFESEKSGGIILLLATITSLVLANSTFGDSYTHFWHIKVADHSISHWINDGLMAVFFLLIGLELEREIYKGELSDLKSASLPIFGAIGGMFMPALIFLVLNCYSPTQRGAGIPMATDIAFAVGILSLLGNKVPVSLKVFLTALAVIDDLGAILVIAIFYTGDLSLTNLAVAISIYLVLIIFNKFKINNLTPYIAGGILMWYFMLNSGIHATITGVLIAFVIPFREGNESSPSYILQHILHKPVAFFILPLFALANTSINIGNSWASGLLENNSLGIISGLIVGKPLGIILLTFIAVKLKFGSLPDDINWNHILGAGFLAGIGFTMSIFITLLAYNDQNLINSSKIAVLIASVIAGTIGFIWLKKSLKP